MPDTPPPTAYVAVGRISGPFGVRGELKVDVLTDVPERFEPASRLFLDGRPVTVDNARINGRDRVIVQLKEIRTRTDAESISRGATLDIPEKDVAPLPDGAYYRFQLIGLEAWVEADNAQIGVVEDVLETGVNDVLIVRSPGKPEELIPNTPEIVTVDMAARRVLIRPVPGLLYEAPVEKPPPPPRRRRRGRR